MGVQTTHAVAPAGSWVQVAEFRPGRTSLRVDLQGGAWIMSMTKACPEQTIDWGNAPAGMYFAYDAANGGPKFELYALRDGQEITEQAWYAWLIPESVDTYTTFVDRTTSGTIELPTYASNIQLVGRGAGGNTFDSDAVAGPSSGGGGPAYCVSANFDMLGTSTLTCFVAPPGAPNPVGEPPDNWMSRTGVIPTTTAHGILCASGKNGALPGGGPGGAGGLAAASIGLVKHSGGNGGTTAPFAMGFGGSGGGGGGSGTPTADGTNGNDGAGGAATLTTGGVEGGGFGGASDGIDQEGGTSGSGGGSGGCGVTVPGVTGSAPAGNFGGVGVYYDLPVDGIFTTVESFTTPPQYDPRERQEDDATLTIPMPSLSPEALKHLRSLRAKLLTHEESSHVE